MTQTATIKNYRTGGTSEVKVGDEVGFKCDVEQTGTITAIERNAWNGEMYLTISAGPDGFDGDYISGNSETQISASEAWTCK